MIESYYNDKETAESNSTAELKLPVRPWLRFWARHLDTFVFSFLIGTLLEYMPISMNFSGINGFLFSVIVLIIWIPIEAALLSTAGTTLGKLLLGIKVRSMDGSKLSFQQALKRSALVWWRGQGAGIPIISFLANLNGYQTLKHDLGKTTWDRDACTIVFHRPKVLWSEILIYLVIALLVFYRCYAWLLRFK